MRCSSRPPFSGRFSIRTATAPSRPRGCSGFDRGTSRREAARTRRAVSTSRPLRRRPRLPASRPRRQGRNHPRHARSEMRTRGHRSSGRRRDTNIAVPARTRAGMAHNMPAHQLPHLPPFTEFRETLEARSDGSSAASTATVSPSAVRSCATPTSRRVSTRSGPGQPTRPATPTPTPPAARSSAPRARQPQKHRR